MSAPRRREPDLSDAAAVLAARVVVPEHVVHRRFGQESVALNLRTGRYYGLNQTAAQMFEQLRGAATVAGTLAPLVHRFDQPPETIEHDLVGLCRVLAERGLIELHVDAP